MTPNIGWYHRELELLHAAQARVDAEGRIIHQIKRRIRQLVGLDRAARSASAR